MVNGPVVVSRRTAHDGATDIGHTLAGKCETILDKRVIARSQLGESTTIDAEHGKLIAADLARRYG